jgi:hypothetical protein
MGIIYNEYYADLVILQQTTVGFFVVVIHPALPTATIAQQRSARNTAHPTIRMIFM